MRAWWSLMGSNVTPSDLDGLHCGPSSPISADTAPQVTPSDLDGLHCGVTATESMAALAVPESPRPIWTGSIAAAAAMAGQW